MIKKNKELEILLTGKFNEEDDEEIENELNKLIEEDDLENTENLPNVPTHDLPTVEKSKNSGQSNKKIELMAN